MCIYKPYSGIFLKRCNRYHLEVSLVCAAMVGHRETQKKVKRAVDNLPFSDDIPRSPSTSMKQKQMEWTLSGLHALKAPIAAGLKHTLSVVDIDNTKVIQ